MHYPFPNGKYSESQVPSLLRNAALIGAMLLLRDTGGTKRKQD